MKIKITGLFKKEEKLILKAAFKARRPLSVKEISKRSTISWVTADKYAKELVKRNWLVTVDVGKRKRYEFNYDRIGDW